MFFYKVEKMTRASAPFPAEMRYNRAPAGSLKLYLLKLCKFERVKKLFEAPARQRLKGDAGDDNRLWHLAMRNQKKTFQTFQTFPSNSPTTHIKTLSAAATSTRPSSLPSGELDLKEKSMV
jgi:hypothetical protein